MASVILWTLTKLQALVSLQSLLVGLVATLSVLLFRFTKTGKNPVPGPFSVPLFGSIFVLPGLLSPVRRHRIRFDMAKKYGKLYRLEFGPITAIFINDAAVLKEAFVTKGEIVSDRLESNRSDELAVKMCLGKGIAGANFGKDFKERRILTLHAMKDFGFGGKSLEETALEEAVCLNERFEAAAAVDNNNNNNIDASAPTDLHQKLIHLAVSNVICSVVFGRRFDYDDEKFVSAVDGIRYIFSQNLTWMARIPLISRLPVVKKRIEKTREEAFKVLAFVEEQIELHKKEFDAGNPKDFIDLCLQKESRDRETAQRSRIGTENIKKIIIDLFLAGTDTTAASLSWFILYMIHFPDVQRRCQKEIDEVSETRGELSSLNASKCFPYTTAALLETQRISSIAPASLPHVVREDTTLGGFDVAKGSLVLANIRFLHLDDGYWEDPEKFDPGRWLDPTDPTKILQHLNFVPFSLGKRRCLGENLAKAEYSVFAISLLRRFRLKMVDPSRPPSLQGFGLIYSPMPFELVMESRKKME